jgi:hypothetical protein
MTDKELLELAAKAAGYTWKWNADSLLIEDEAWHEWNPLTDDSDALRLAVKLQIHMAKYDNYVSACQLGPAWGGEVVVWDHKEPDPYAATRRAITRAAAAIGEAMKS